MSDEEPKKVGLQCLDDETLAAIVEQSLEARQELSCEATEAFAELQRRTPQ